MLPIPPISTLFPYTTLFRSLFSAYLSVLLGFPQTLWRARHLAHHAAQQKVQVKWRGQLLVEAILVAALGRSEEHTSELQSHHDLVCRLLLEKKKQIVCEFNN